MRTYPKPFLGFCFLLLFFLAGAPLSRAQGAKVVSWHPLLEGLQETQYKTNDSKGIPVTLRLYKVDLKKNKLKVVQASDYQTNALSLKDFVAKSGALIGVNAGFFDPEFKPLGLIVREGIQLNPLKPVSWWSVFSIDKSDTPNVTHATEFQGSSSVDLAVESGPRLVIDGNPVTSKPNVSAKTFVGVTPENEVVIGVTESCVVDTTELAQILAKEVKLKHALNFDGGSSTQLYAKVNSYEKDLPGFSPVANGLVVLPKR